MAVKAADEAYQQAGLTVADVNVVELHDCFSTNELIMYEALVRAGIQIDHGNWHAGSLKAARVF